MITVTKIVNVSSSGVAPYTYLWINNDSGCVQSFSNPSGTSTDGVIQTNIVFNNQECSENADISLYVTDSKGCKATFPIQVISPCASLEATGFSEQLNGTTLTVTALHNGVTAGATYTWTWDHMVFTGSDLGTNTLILTINTDRPDIESSTLYVTVTNTSGCKVTTPYTFYFCTPLAQSSSLNICKRPTVSTINKHCFSASACSGEIDWDTFEITFVGTGANYFSLIENEGDGCTTIAANSLGPSGVYTATWTVNDVNGNVSSMGTLTIYYAECGSPGSCIVAPRYVRKLSCDEAAAGTPVTYVIVDLDGIIQVDECEPVWETFEFVDVAPQVASGTGEGATMTTAFGEVNFNSDHEITYTFDSTPSGTETVRWKVAADNGNETGDVEVVIVFDCTEGPVAIVDAYCQACEDTPTEHDVLANDTGGSINPASIVITAFPPVSEGSLNINTTTGEIQFVPAAGFVGVSTYDYKVANWSGVYSNEATVTVTNDCADAGESDTANECISNETEYDLYALIGSADTSGTWTLTDAPTDPVDITVDSVSASYAITDVVGVDHQPIVMLEDGNSPTGAYEFTYTVTDGCSTQSQTITITGSGVAIGEVADSCDYDYSAVNPDDDSSDWNADIQADQIYVTEQAKLIVTKDCGTPVIVQNSTLTDTSRYAYTQIAQATVFTDPIDVGGYLDDILVYHWDGLAETDIVLDVSPTGANLIGPAGTVSGATLIFDGSNYSAMSSALEIVIQNAVANQILIDHTDIDVDVTVAASGYFTIKTKCKHNPTSDWVGIKASDGEVNFHTDAVTTASTTTVTVAVAVLSADGLKATYTTPCGEITAVVIPDSAVIDIATTDYNTVQLTGTALITITGDDGNPTNVTCDERTLTATLTPTCTGTVTYLWSNGATTQSITVSTLGLYTVDVTCSDYTCTNHAEITIV